MNDTSTVRRSAKKAVGQGRFDRGSFIAFSDGSIEVEIAGVKQVFRDLTELKNYARQLQLTTADQPVQTVPSYKALPTFQSFKVAGQQLFLPVGMKQAW
jgi:hypothetical protein